MQNKSKMEDSPLIDNPNSNSSSLSKHNLNPKSGSDNDIKQEPTSYNEERNNKRFSNFKSFLILTRGSFSVGYFTLQEVIGEGGFFLSAGVMLITTILVSYGVYRSCTISENIEASHPSSNEEGILDRKGRPTRIRVYEDLSMYTKYPTMNSCIIMVSCLMINIGNIVLFVVSLSQFLEKFIPIHYAIIRLIISVISILPFLYFQVPEDLKLLTTPSLICFIFVVMFQMIYNYYEIFETGTYNYTLFDLDGAISLFTVCSFQVEVLGYLFNIRNSTKDNSQMKYLGPLAISLVMIVKYIGSLSYILVSPKYTKWYILTLLALHVPRPQVFGSPILPSVLDPIQRPGVHYAVEYFLHQPNADLCSERVLRKFKIGEEICSKRGRR